MQITHIESFLVSPGKNMENPPEVKGAMLSLAGPVYELLNVIFEKSDKECDTPIRFVMGADGSQKNIVRNLITSFISDPTEGKGKALAEKMRDSTTPKSGAALFFIILGKDGQQSKIVLSRFPADQGILAELRKNTLQVEFIERIFMKNAQSYKAALFKGTSLKGDFWKGTAIDKQANELANYWIYEFLDSDFETTSKFGTQRFARAMRDASRKTESLPVKKQLLSVANLVHGFGGQSTTINEISERYRLSTATREAIVDQLANPALADDVFILDIEEFSKSAAYSSIELDNGAILSAPPDQFDKCFQREIIDDNTNYTRFVTEGRIVDERIKGHS